MSDADFVESEVHAAINPRDSNNIIVSPIQTGNSAEEGLICPIYYTKNFGRTWQQSTFRTVPRGDGIANMGGGDPIVGFDGNGTAYIFWISLYVTSDNSDTTNFGIFWAYSNDGGATWTQPDSDAVALGHLINDPTAPQELFDKEWLAVDRSNSPHVNTLYLAFLQATQIGATGELAIAVRKKAPGSMSFTQKSARVAGSDFTTLQFASIDVDPDGKVHVTFFGTKDQEHYALWHSVSSDGGETFSEPARIADLHLPRFSPDAANEAILGIEPSRFYPCPQFCIDNSNSSMRGNLYITWTADGLATRSGNGLDIYLARSTDGGATWERPIVVNSDARDRERHQYYSSIAVSPGGVVTVTWYDRRDDPEGRATNYYMAQSFDGGRTFAKNFPVSAQPTDFASVGEMNGGFGIGEYTQVLSTSGYAIPVWTDGRSNDGDLNIYAAFVPLDRTSTGVERLTSVTEKIEIGDAAIDGNRVRIGYRLSAASRLTITMVDAAGRRMAAPQSRLHEPGSDEWSIDISGMPSGTYYCRLESEFGTAVRAVGVAR